MLNFWLAAESLLVVVSSVCMFVSVSCQCPRASTKRRTVRCALSLLFFRLLSPCRHVPSERCTSCLISCAITLHRVSRRCLGLRTDIGQMENFVRRSVSYEAQSCRLESNRVTSRFVYISDLSRDASYHTLSHQAPAEMNEINGVQQVDFEVLCRSCEAH